MALGGTENQLRPRVMSRTDIIRNFVSANWTLIFANAESECEEVILGMGAHI